MKLRLLSVSLFPALLFVGCAKKDTAPVSTVSANSPASVTPVAAAVPAPAAAPSAKSAKSDVRVIEITANDQMQFNIKTIEAKVGEEIKVILNNIGSLPKEAMGHNWVLLKAGTDVNAFATASMTAKATDYIAPNLKDQVLAFIPVLGPKQKADVTFKIPAAGEYVYVCSFPGHFMIMRGTIIAK
jgi:azurin